MTKGESCIVSDERTSPAEGKPRQVNTNKTLQSRTNQYCQSYLTLHATHANFKQSHILFRFQERV